jgi:hypothetical protein
MRRLLLALSLFAVAAPASAKPKEVVKESAKTGGHAVVDGTRTVGRTVRSFFKGGPQDAKQTWKDNAHKTRDDARAGGRKVKSAAH